MDFDALPGSAPVADPPEATVLFAIGSWYDALHVGPVIREVRRRAALDTVVVQAGSAADREVAGVLLRRLADQPVEHAIALDELSEIQALARVLAEAERLMARLRPQVVVLAGDTPATVAHALVAAKLGLAIARLGAGGRASRGGPPDAVAVLPDRLADLLFTADADAARALVTSGIPPWRMHASGPTLADALRRVSPGMPGPLAGGDEELARPAGRISEALVANYVIRPATAL